MGQFIGEKQAITAMINKAIKSCDPIVSDSSRQRNCKRERERERERERLKERER